MQYQFRPIQQWPRALTRDRKSSPFRATYRQTIDLLETELDHLKARNVVVQLALRPDDIRLDGLPRANAKPATHPGVILSFEKWMPTGRRNEQVPLGRMTPFSMPCDAFTDWESNLRAIALSLEALRKVDRYGVTQSGEQYTGWKALPDGGAASTRETAAAFLSEHSGIVVTAQHTDRDALTRAYRSAARKLHPDAGGDHDDFIKLGKAVETLKGKE